MKKAITKKIYVDNAIYNAFSKICRSYGIPAQTQLGMMIEEFVAKQQEIKNNSDLPLNCENMKKCESVPADRNNSQNYLNDSSISFPGQQVFNPSPLHHSEAPAIPESLYGGAHCDDFLKPAKEVK